MADGDIIEINNERGVMVYYFNPVTFEYIQEYFTTFEDPMVKDRFPVPKKATMIKPMIAGVNEKQIYDKDTSTWTLVDDYRGQTWYHPTDYTKDPETYIELGQSPDSSWVTPKPYYIEEARIHKLEELSYKCTEEIVNGYVSDALGTDHHYPCNLWEQQTLIAMSFQANVDGVSAEPFVYWCTNDTVNVTDDAGWARRDHTVSEILEVSRAASTHVSACKDKSELRVIETKLATNQTEMEAVVWV